MRAWPSRRGAPPSFDPTAVERRYRFHRTRRRIRQQRRQERALARLRFLAVSLSLLVASAYVSLIVWRQVERLFGF